VGLARPSHEGSGCGLRVVGSVSTCGFTILAERQLFPDHTLPFDARGMDVDDEIAAGLGDVVVEFEREL